MKPTRPAIDAATISRPGRDHGPGADPRDESRRGVGHHQQHDRERHAAQPGAERVVAEHELQVLGLEEDRAEQAEVERGHREARGGEPGVAEQSQVEHRVRARRSSTTTNAASDPNAIDERDDHGRARPAAARAFDDRVDERRQADDRQQRAGDVERRACRVARGRHEEAPATIAATQIGTFTQNTEPQRTAAGAAHPRPVRARCRCPPVPAQTAMARCRSAASGKTLVRIESVAGKTSAAPTPVSARSAISCVGVRRRAPTRPTPTPKTTSPVGEGAPAPEPVAEAAGGEQQARRTRRCSRRRSTAAARRRPQARRPGSGSATLRIVVSIVTTISDRQRTASAHQRRGRRSGSAAVAGTGRE